MKTVKLVAKNVFAQKILEYATYPDEWKVLAQRPDVLWVVNREGPWLLIKPMECKDSHLDRWVSLTDDSDFFVEILS